MITFWAATASSTGMSRFMRVSMYLDEKFVLGQAAKATVAVTQICCFVRMRISSVVKPVTTRGRTVPPLNVGMAIIGFVAPVYWTMTLWISSLATARSAGSRWVMSVIIRKGLEYARQNVPDAASNPAHRYRESTPLMRSSTPLPSRRRPRIAGVECAWCSPGEEETGVRETPAAAGIHGGFGAI